MWAWRMMSTNKQGIGVGCGRGKEVPEKFRFRRMGGAKRYPSPPGGRWVSLRSAHPTDPSRRRHLIQEPGDAADASVAEHGEIRTLDRAVAAIGPEAPGEA